jgi:hypothetical protein
VNRLLINGLLASVSFILALGPVQSFAKVHNIEPLFIGEYVELTQLTPKEKTLVATEQETVGIVNGLTVKEKKALKKV